MTQNDSVTYCNPVILNDTPDPYVIKVGTDYYLYCTGISEDRKQAIPVYHSTDLVHWEWVRYAMHVPDSWQAWNRYDFWAPEVIVHDGTYYMYYSASTDGHVGTRHVGVATANRPDGLFIDSGKPLLPFQSIDGHLFKDDDGKMYLFFCMDQCNSYPSGHIYAVEMDTPTTFQGEPKLMMPYMRDIWEEGPFVLRKRDTYFLMYSCGRWQDDSYRVEYATSMHPMGPYVRVPDDKAPGPVLVSTVDVKGPGHHSVTKALDGETDIIVYHGWNPEFTIGRMARIDVLRYADGRLSCDGPSIEPRTLYVGCRPN